MLKYSIPENHWYELHPEGTCPGVRSGMKITAISNNEEKATKLFFFGGYITKDILHCNDSYIYDIEDNFFTKIEPKTPLSLPIRRTDHSIVSYEDNMYIFGGLGEKKLILADFQKFNVRNYCWKAILSEGVPIKQRFGHVACVYSGSMFVFGGWDGKKCLNDLYQYSFITNIWYELKNSGEQPSPRYRHEGVVFRNSFFIFGGVNESQTRFNDLYQFSFEIKEWKRINATGCIPTPRTFHRITIHSNLLISVGGFDGTKKNELFFLALEKKDFEEEEKFSLSRMATLKEEDEYSPSKISETTVAQILSKQVKELSEKLQREEERHLCKVYF